MSLSDLAATGSFVSGIAVVITLIFLLLQMRQTNLNQRALMQQMRSARTIDTILRESDGYLSPIFARAFQNDPSMEEAEILSFVQAIEATFFNWEDSYKQHQAGTIDKDSFESDINSFRQLITIPALRVAWRLTRDYYCSGFRQIGDKLVSETKAAPLPTFKSRWTAMMAEEFADAA
jgi:hypothetical protein